MPSSYSPLLRLELIGSGEQAGLWGETTNKNLGTLLEQAIAGVTTISLSGGAGTYTLTSLSGTQDQARSAVLKFIGTPSGAKTIEIPSSEKLYVVRNDSGQTITFKTANQILYPAEGGVELLDGEATLVFCDGLNAKAGIQTAAVGTLTVSGGGTGATSFTAGFIKSSGGTGSLTSSATVSLSTDVSGTLPVTSGGTGQTSFTSGRMLIGNGTGTLAVLGGSSAGQVATWDGTQWTAATPVTGGVTSFNGRTGGVTPVVGDYSAYYPSLSTAYSNPSWISSLAGSKITGYVANATSADTASTASTATSATFASSAGTVPWTGVTGAPSVVTTNTTQTISGTKIFTGGIQSQAYNFTATESIYYSGGYVDTAIGGTTRARVFNTGDFQIFGSNATKASGTAWINPSDKRIKDNILDYAKGLSVLNQLQVRTWTYNGKGGSIAGAKGLGVVADELISVLPDAVMEQDVKLNPDDPDTVKLKNVDASEITWLLVKSVQELSAKVTALEAEVTALKA